MAKYMGSGLIDSADYHVVKWIGKTKDGSAITITLPKAVNLGNVDWTFAEKNDTVASITFTGVYENTDAASTSNDECWTVEIDGGISAGAGEILLGAGALVIDSTTVALTRGGGSFNVAREFREINADGDRGAVADRILMETSRPTLTMNVLTMLTNFSKLYSCVKTVS